MITCLLDHFADRPWVAPHSLLIQDIPLHLCLAEADFSTRSRFHILPEQEAEPGVTHESGKVAPDPLTKAVASGSTASSPPESLAYTVSRSICRYPTGLCSESFSMSALLKCSNANALAARCGEIPGRFMTRPPCASNGSGDNQTTCHPGGRNVRHPPRFL